MRITVTEANGVQHTFETHSMSIAIEGFGDHYSEDGCGTPVFLEEYEGVKLSVWADINKDDPTHQIDLSGAKESERKTE